jgi:uncharacterized membrane protein (UPF0127 family)
LKRKSSVNNDVREYINKLRILNKTRGAVLSENASYAHSFYGRLRGLMFTEPADLVLASPKETVEHSSIHMFFMKYPIDVVWANSEGVVVDVKRRIPPASILAPKTWGVIRPKVSAKYVVELGKSSAGETRIGDKIVLS